MARAAELARALTRWLALPGRLALLLGSRKVPESSCIRYVTLDSFRRVPIGDGHRQRRATRVRASRDAHSTIGRGASAYHFSPRDRLASSLLRASKSEV